MKVVLLVLAFLVCGNITQGGISPNTIQEQGVVFGITELTQNRSQVEVKAYDVVGELHVQLFNSNDISVYDNTVSGNPAVDIINTTNFADGIYTLVISDLESTEEYIIEINND